MMKIPDGLRREQISHTSPEQKEIPTIKVVRVIPFQSISDKEINEATNLSNLYFTKSLWIRKGPGSKNENQVMPIGGKVDEEEVPDEEKGLIKASLRELREETHLIPKFRSAALMNSKQNYSFTNKTGENKREARFITVELLPSNYDIPYPMDNEEDKIGEFISLDLEDLKNFFEKNKTEKDGEELRILDSLENEKSIKQEIIDAQKIAEMEKKKKIIATIIKNRFNDNQLKDFEILDPSAKFDEVQSYWEKFVITHKIDAETVKKALKEADYTEYLEDIEQKFEKDKKILVPTINLIFPLLFGDKIEGKEILKLIKENPQLEKLYQVSKLLSYYNLHNQGDENATKKLKKTLGIESEEKEQINEATLKKYLQEIGFIDSSFTFYFNDLAVEVDELFRQLNNDLGMKLSGFQMDQKNEVQTKNLEETVELAFSKEIGKIQRFEAQRKLVLVYMLHDIKSYLMDTLNTGIGKLDKLEGSIEIKKEGEEGNTSGKRELLLNGKSFEVKIERRTKTLRSLLRKAIVRDNFDLSSFSDVFAESITFIDTENFKNNFGEFKLELVENELPCEKISDAKGRLMSRENIKDQRMPKVVFEYIRELTTKIPEGSSLEIVEWKGLPKEGATFNSNSAGGGSKIRMCKFYINYYTNDGKKSSREVQIFLPKEIEDPDNGEKKVVDGGYDNAYKKLDDTSYAMNRLLQAGMHRSMIELLFPVAVYGESVKSVFEKSKT